MEETKSGVDAVAVKSMRLRSGRCGCRLVDGGGLRWGLWWSRSVGRTTVGFYGSGAASVSRLGEGRLVVLCQIGVILVSIFI